MSALFINPNPTILASQISDATAAGIGLIKSLPTPTLDSVVCIAGNNVASFVTGKTQTELSGISSIASDRGVLVTLT